MLSNEHNSHETQKFLDMHGNLTVAEFLHIRLNDNFPNFDSTPLTRGLGLKTCI